MYYKITNKECELYKKFKALREKELSIQENNEKAIEEKTGMTWKGFYGHHGQQNFHRVTTYSGFEFKETDKIDPKIWKESKDHKGIYEPNRRTKVGREMAEFILNGVKKGDWFSIVFDILGMKSPHGKFAFPFVEYENDTVILWLEDKFDIENEFVTEITKREFEEIRKN